MASLYPSPDSALSWRKPSSQPCQSAYLHIPFCRRRCYYCDFPVSVVGDHARGEQSATIIRYLQALETEIRSTASQGHRLETVFFGGGTPSLLSPAQVARLLTGLDQQFGLDRQAEISIEIDPGTFDLTQLQGYVAAGVNRVSLGVQAFQSELLAVCGRTHTRADIDVAIACLEQVGVPNFSLDLISGLPHQTLEQWQASLETAVAIGPAHLSAYDLIVEPGTAFDRRYQPNAQPLPSETIAAQMYRMAQQILTGAGYEHYEISNYARPGFQCRHNRVYWENRPFYGFGMGAASYLQGRRLTRPRKTRDYYAWVDRLQESQGDQPIEATDQTLLDCLCDTLMLGLRLTEGLSVAQLSEQFGWEKVKQVMGYLRSHQQRGWVNLPDDGDDFAQSHHGRISLTDPEGLLFSNTILSDLFARLSE